MKKKIVFNGKVVAKNYTYPLQSNQSKQPVVPQEKLYPEFWNIKE